MDMAAALHMMQNLDEMLSAAQLSSTHSNMDENEVKNSTKF